MIVAIIPARGGSKRIPRKNIRDFLGRPLISYPISAARASGVFDRIIVSTDSEEIMKTAVESGAEVPFIRPPELSDDHTPTNPVLMHALKRLEEDGYAVDSFCCIYSNPFITAFSLEQSYRLMIDRDVTSVVPVTTFDFPIFRAFRKTSAGGLEYVYPEHASTRSQDLPETCHDVGQFYWCRTKAFMEDGKVMHADTIPFMISRLLCQDIDTPEDWDVAEKLYRTFVVETKSERGKAGD